MTSGFDWPGLMRAGLTHLRLSPEAFWRLTPLELRMMLGAEQALPPLTKARLDELALIYPDQTKGAKDVRVRRSTRPDNGA